MGGESKMSSRVRTVYVVTDAETGERSGWSRKAYAVAEVLAIVNERYGSDPHAIGFKASFEGMPSIICDVPIDHESLVYGSGWRDGREFVEAVADAEAHRKATQGTGRRRVKRR